MGLIDPGARDYDDVNEMLTSTRSLRTGSRITPTARRFTWPAPTASPRSAVTPAAGRPRRRGRGHEPRRLDLGGGNAAANAGMAFNFPALGGGGGGGGARRARRGPPGAERTFDDVKRDARAAGSTRSPSCSIRRAPTPGPAAGKTDRLDSRGARAGGRARRCRCSPPPIASARTSATRWRSPTATRSHRDQRRHRGAQRGARSSRRTTSPSSSATC